MLARLCCYLSVTLTLYRKVDAETSTAPRTWSVWYNSHSPSSSEPDDDESIDKIRQRGFDVCSGDFPIDVMCREVQNRAVTFNSRTRQIASNYLFLPCTTKGIICRELDQVNSTCSDYEVQFQCNSIKPSLTNTENIVIIVVAASLSVLLPIVCITSMHIIRRKRERRQSQVPINNESTEQSAQTESLDLPPSYSVLFGEGVLGPQAVTLSASTDMTLTVSTADGEIEIPLATSRRGSRQYSNRLELIPEISVTNRDHENTRQEVECQSYSNSPSRRRQRSLRRRCPNLHLSIFEVLSLSEPDSPPPSSASSQTSTFSYMCTPPPSYKDAIFFTGASKDVYIQVLGGSLNQPEAISRLAEQSENQAVGGSTSLSYGASLSGISPGTGNESLNNREINDLRDDETSELDEYEYNTRF